VKRRNARRAKRKKPRSVLHLKSANSNNIAMHQTPVSMQPPGFAVPRLLVTERLLDRLCSDLPIPRPRPRRSSRSLSRSNLLLCRYLWHPAPHLSHKHNLLPDHSLKPCRSTRSLPASPCLLPRNL
jgi:hypothetical protein